MPETLSYQITLNCPIGADVRQSEELEVSEAERNDIEIDQDTQGVLGSPDIARVILEKIASSNVVVADVTLVAAGKEDKKHINSNVAIELGFTYGKNGDEAVLKIMNTHYGSADELPFDLRTRRHPVQYCLSPDADAASKRAELARLASELTGILKLYLAQPSNPTNAQHLETPFVERRGHYWKPIEVIVPENPPYVRSDTYCTVPSVIYFRCIPSAELPPLTSREALDAVSSVAPLMSASGYSNSRNKWGAVSHCIAHDGDIMGFTQVFKNRELWGVDAYYSNPWTSSEDEGVDSKRFIPSGAVQRDYPRAITSIRNAADALGYGESYTIEMGVSGAAGLHLAIDKRYWESLPGPLFDDDVFFRKTIAKDTPVGDIMNVFWEMLFSEAGREPPTELIWKSHA